MARDTSEIYDVPGGISHRWLPAVDSGVVNESGSQSSDWCLHNVMDIRILKCAQFLLTPTIGREMLTTFCVEDSDIVIADRGFSNRRGIKHIIEYGGDVILRINSCSLPILTEKGSKFQQINHLRALESDAYGEWVARMMAEGKESSVRV